MNTFFRIHLILLTVGLNLPTPYLLTGQDHWRLTTTKSADEHPFTYYELDLQAFIQSIKNKDSVNTPTDPGKMERLLFTTRSNFDPALASKYPAIRSWVAQASTSTVYLDLYHTEIHLFILGETGAKFIEPVSGHANLYEWMSADHLSSQHQTPIKYQCQNDDDISHQQLTPQGTYRRMPAEKISLRTYRLALATTGEFSNRLGSTNEAILAGLNGHLTRINAVYIKESAIQFNLVANNDTLLFTDSATDPYTNGNTTLMLSQNPPVLNERIGLNNYDIGHVFGTNAGGVALLSSVCTANKGAGVSCSYGPFTDLLFYTIPCHEIGHQFSATHIFNLCDNSNETSSSGFEPGSGSTIMSYAGASNCGPNYVQDMPDPYFNSFNLQQIKTYAKVSTGALCGTKTDLVNLTPIPTITAKTNGYIPIGTPFELSGTATDDRTTTVYTWEELDLGPQSTLGQPTGTAPLFRSFSPDKSGTRIFPSLPYILANSININEILPSTTRPLTFRFTARDLDPTGGGTQWEELAFQSTAMAGPFKLTCLNTDTVINQSSLIYVTWQVANTHKKPINCDSVIIYWSDNEGATFEIIKKTPNDGGEWITLPQTSTEHGRIKIKASDNLFFDINNGNIIVIPVFPALPGLGAEQDLLPICTGVTQAIKLFTSASRTNDTIRLLNPKAPASIKNIFFQKYSLAPSDTTSLFITVDPTAISQTIPLILKGVRHNLDTIAITINIKILSSNQILISPVNGADQVSTNVALQWQKIPSEGDYILELSSHASFDSILWSKVITEQDTVATPAIGLLQNRLYFWRIRPQIFCQSNQYQFSVFHTQSLECKTYTATDLPKFISATGTPTVVSKINVPDSFAITQITIPTVRGTHDFVGDLTMSLHAPNGDSSILWSRQCNNLSNFYLGLDDQALIDIACPLTDRKLHKPATPLNQITKSNSNGDWTLKVRDGNSGAGGSVDEWILQLCGIVPGIGPTLSSSNPIATFEFKSTVVNDNLVKAIDPDSNPDQIIYTLLESPVLGTLIKNEHDTLRLGSSFTQMDINTGKIRFWGKSVLADTLEKIKIILVDEKNNWSGIQSITLKVLNDITIAVVDKANTNPLKIYPNPFSRLLTFENSSFRPISINIYSMQGIQVYKLQLGALEKRTEYIYIPGGIYVIQYLDGTNKVKSLKIIAIKS